MLPSFAVPFLLLLRRSSARPAALRSVPPPPQLRGACFSRPPPVLLVRSGCSRPGGVLRFPPSLRHVVRRRQPPLFRDLPPTFLAFVLFLCCPVLPLLPNPFAFRPATRPPSSCRASPLLLLLLFVLQGFLLHRSLLPPLSCRALRAASAARCFVLRLLVLRMLFVGASFVAPPFVMPFVAASAILGSALPLPPPLHSWGFICCPLLPLLLPPSLVVSVTRIPESCRRASSLLASDVVVAAARLSAHPPARCSPPLLLRRPVLVAWVLLIGAQFFRLLVLLPRSSSFVAPGCCCRCCCWHGASLTLQRDLL